MLEENTRLYSQTSASSSKPYERRSYRIPFALKVAPVDDMYMTPSRLIITLCFPCDKLVRSKCAVCAIFIVLTSKNTKGVI